MTRSIAAVLAAVAALAAGCSHNPGYFPYLLPGGVIRQTHAKPRGPGYFRNFDPKAVRLVVSPGQQVNAPLGSQVVLVGSVLDRDDQPRRSRRIEWLLDGPGHIVEADESGVFPGRGYKVDNKYAVTYTNYFTKTITRGNTDPGDDVVIAPGQTFCVVSSAVPGETVVTAYAPEVFDWSCGRVVVRIVWGDGRFVFPPPAVVRSGTEHTLVTAVTGTAADPLPSGYRIRYRVLDGAPAVLVSRGGSGTGASLSGTGGQEAEVFTDADGAAAVRLVQQVPKPGKTRIAIEVVKPPEPGGTGPGVVVGRRETVVEWAEPKLTLGIEAPPVAGSSTGFPVTISLENEAAVDSRAARVRVTLSDRATLDRSDPPPVRQEPDGTLTFELPPVPGRSRQEVTLQVRPARPGSVTITAEATTDDGLQARHRVVTRVEPARLQALVEAPATALVGDTIPFKVAVTNAGAAPAENVVARVRFDDGLRAATAQNPVELAAGTLAPGQTKVLELPLHAPAAGRFAVRAEAVADGHLTAAANPVAVDVRRVELTVTAAAPRLAYLNQEFDWTVTVRNTGETAVGTVVVRGAVPVEVRAKSASDGGRVGSASVEWTIPELRPGEERTWRVTAEALRLAERATLVVTATGQAPGGTRTVEARAEAGVAIIGTPALSLELATPAGLVEVGRRLAVQVRVKNQGTVSARDVDVTAFVPPEFHALRGRGPGDGPARIEGTGRVVFPPLSELRPGETATFTVEMEAARAGDARPRAEVRAAHLTAPLKEEQAVRVTAR